MTVLVVAAHFAWDEYPGLRAGRLYSGAGDIARHPVGDAHAVVDAGDVDTVCGRPRASFPYEFTPPVRLSSAQLCAVCELATTSRV